MFCQTCGLEIPGDVHFCKRCGAAVVTASPVSATRTAPYVYGPVSGSAAPVPAQAPPQPPSLTLAPRPPVVAGRGLPLLYRYFAVACVLALLAGVLAAYVTRPTDEGEVVASLPVGPEGGVVSLGQKASLNIPAGAMNKTERIVVRRAPIRQRVRIIPPGLPPRLFPAGGLVIYVFGPRTIIFLKPVTIILPLPDPAMPAIIFVFANGQITFVGGTVNAANGTIAIQTTSFGFGGSSVTQVISG